MRYLKHLWFCLLFTLPALGQVSNPGVLYQAAAPSGACAPAPPVRVVDSTGTMYTCDNGTWAAISGGGGGTIPATSLVLKGDGSAGVSVAASPATDYSLPPGIWTREGTIISPNNTEQFNATEIVPIYNTWSSPTLLTGITAPFWQFYWTCGYTTTALCYGESAEATAPPVRAATPVIAAATPGVAHGWVVYQSSTSTYYAFECNGAVNCSEFDIYSSTTPNGTFSLVQSAVLTLGTSGDWDANNLGNIFIINTSGSNWLGMYDGYGSSGIWMSGVFSCTGNPPSMTCGKYSGNPVITLNSGASLSAAPDLHQVNGVWYDLTECNTAGTGNLPTNACVYQATTFLANDWTIDNGGAPVFSRKTSDEGVGSATGQIGNPHWIQPTANPPTYLFYTGVLAQNGTTPDAFHIKVATTGLSLAQLVQTNEGNGSGYHSNGSFNNLNISPCVYMDPNYFRVPCGTTQVFNDGLNYFTGGSGYPGFGQNYYYNGSANVLSSAGGASAGFLDVANDIYHFQMAPAGSAGGAASLTDFYQASSTGFTYYVPHTLKFANPSTTWWDTNTGDQFAVGIFNGYAYFSAPGSAPGFISFTGFGSTPVAAMQSDGVFGFTGADIFAAPDTTMTRAAAGVIGFQAITTAVYTVSTLPTASAVPAGTQVIVSDANSFTPGTCTGSGSDYMIAVSNGTSWSCH